MKIYAVTEPKYSETLWCGNILQGINDKIMKHRHSLEILKETDDFSDIPAAIVMGGSSSWVELIMEKMEETGTKPIVIYCLPQNRIYNASYVVEDDVQAMALGVDYLKSCGKDKIALYGAKSNVFVDFSAFFNKQDVYIYDGDLKRCYENFKKNIDRYNAVFFVNYVAAVSCMRYFKRDGIRVPEDIFAVVNNDNSVMFDLMTPSLTTIVSDKQSLGKQAVGTYLYLMKQPLNVNITVTLPQKLKIGESTAGIEYVKSVNGKRSESAYREYIVSGEEETIVKIENMLRKCDDIDYNIIKNLKNGLTYTQMANSLFISENTVKYRMGRLLKFSGASSKEEFLAILGEYVDIGKIC